jgi:hypothetical protein
MKTNREKFLDKHNLPADTSLSLLEISKLAKMPLNALRKVFNRGIGAAKTNPQSVRLKPGTKYGPAYKKNVDAPASAKLSPETWAYGRIFAFVMKTPKVFYGADKDVAEMYSLL